MFQALAEAERIEAVEKTEIYVHDFKVPIPIPLEAGAAIHEPVAARWTVRRRIALFVRETPAAWTSSVAPLTPMGTGESP